MPTHKPGVKKREKPRKEAAKGCQNLTSFFDTTTRWSIKKFISFSFFFFFSNLLRSLYLNLIWFWLYFLSGMKNLIKNKITRYYIRLYSFVKKHDIDKVKQLCKLQSWELWGIHVNFLAKPSRLGENLFMKNWKSYLQNFFEN